MTAEGQLVNAKSILSVLTLGVNHGHRIQIDAEGKQADEALAALIELVESNFGEDEK
jgi:phosphotransferase system HPr (HPr) family protein